MAAPPAAVLPLLVAGQAVHATDEAWVSPAAGGWAPTHILDGAVTVSAENVWRREASLTLHPDTDRSLVVPSGQRIRLRRTYHLPSGADVSCGLGVLRVTGYDHERDGAWTVTGRSLEYEVQRARFLTARIVAGRTVVDQIEALVREAVPDAAIASSATRDRYARPMTVEDDRWGAVDGTDESLARAIGARVWCDGVGAFRVTDLPAAGDSPVWIPDFGAAVVDARESSDEDGTYNVVVGRGNRPDDDGPVPFGLWWDDNPNSGTYVGDAVDALLRGTVSVQEIDGLPWGTRGFGASPYFLDSPQFSSDFEARMGATTFGQSQAGVLRRVELSCIPVPWLEPDDTIDVPTAAGHERHVIESYTLGVAASSGAPMSLQTREVAT
ncbi:DUF5047 domain-containing protein [Phycicoccus endophyticus]|uniref:DUF5047 domain-containing protein n=1 Tax=Phycicoccus endophyticus TaxID=1690220 RepID=A0A7G9R3G0_9MICO|nr:DUF5047 domain-containing protein [Phycicoccus endophyticus]NHI19891.1 DUF5047 domain-containing protein [Phycicoccus endophyticus]QNN50135.1 DUF5047 domain-containing protein [Phycicoccus endophyticus]GGL27737.1 hypothetical protein GCM10012283_07420 [Phycicoccus endophyticus]